ncbi:TPA: hypothetical protein U2D27_000934 [Streptococcus suis]|nr:hypothetical protein [Streptococcus suis]HEM6362935.1 hypothetical protein [Streptococcus suis]HEM6402875.1 hypothetical protein [Streptococcus suis]
MNNVFDFESIEYLYIFDYYDIPLSFITKKIDDKYYFVYAIDFDTFFVKPLSVKNLKLLFSDITTHELLQEFYSEDDFSILRRETDNTFTTKNVKLFELENNINVSEYFPEDDSKFERDFISGKSFNTLCSEYTTTFSDVLNNKQLTIKLVDNHNSNSADLAVVTKAINLMDNFIEGTKEFLRGHSVFPNGKLVLTPFTPGSFNINFELVRPEEVTLFEDEFELYFDDFIVFTESINHKEASDVYSDVIFEDKKIVKSFIEFYNVIKENELTVTLEKDKNKLSTIIVNEQSDKFIHDLGSLIQKQDDSEMISEVFDFEGIVSSASNARNNVSIRTLSGSVKAKFSKELFGEIRRMDRTISVSSEIQGQWLKQTFLDEKRNVIAEKYEILNFVQNI